MAMIEDKTGLLAAEFHPDMLKGKAYRHGGHLYPPPTTDIVYLTRHRWAKETPTRPHPAQVAGKAYHHKIFHFTPEPDVPGGSMQTDISYLINPHPDMLKGKAFRHKIVIQIPPPVSGASMETDIAYLINPHPDLLKGHHKRRRSHPTDFVAPPARLARSRMARPPEPNMGLLLDTNTTLRRKSFPADAVFIEFTETYLHS